MIAISLLEEEGAKPQETLTARGMSFKTLVDGDSVAMEKFFVRGTPRPFLSTRKGRSLWQRGCLIRMIHA
ncbi:hypothetical protein P4S73_15540 [Paraglaciecola sp. Hal342]